MCSDTMYGSGVDPFFAVVLLSLKSNGVILACEKRVKSFLDLVFEVWYERRRHALCLPLRMPQRQLICNV